MLVKKDRKVNTFQDNENTKEILKDLIPISDRALKEANIPYKANTLRRWRSAGKNLDLFIKISGKVFFNRRRYIQRVLEAEREALEMEKISGKISGSLWTYK